ncbi:MAG: helix-turn-helix domain-containing protein [Ktedonobacteraceae bacterium]|nr:helix-turn-helix domain-containing protein [Ktedonobacteraceae bacterium]
MPAKEPKRRPPSTLAKVLKTYRETYKLTQEDLAALLDEDPRQIRRWENNETSVKDPGHLRAIADRLAIPYEHLGISPSLYIPLTLEQINTTIDTIWFLIDEARISEGHAIAEKLLQQVTHQFVARTQDATFLCTFARLYHAIAKATSLSVRSDNVGQAVYYYQQMEYFARQLKDETLINLSLTYQGDMQRRKGDIPRALVLLEGACETTPSADEAARGNMLQFLARCYLRANRLDEFEAAMKEAEVLAHVAGHRMRDFRLAYVYEEYASSYGTLGRTQEALDYVERAEKVQPFTKSVEMLLKLARAEILLRVGDISTGMPLAVEVATYAREHGHNRRLERISALKRYMHQQTLNYGKAEAALSEVLEGTCNER